MSAPPKLPVHERIRLRQMAERRRQLTKEIARLQEERRAIPSFKELAEQCGACYAVVRRAVAGDPYKNPHPLDEEGRAA